MTATYALVRPERVKFGSINFTAKIQATDMIVDKACPICLVGIVPYGDVICAHCSDERQLEIEADMAEACREVRERLIARET